MISKEGELRYKKTSTSNSITLSDYNDEDLIYLNKQNYIPFKVEHQSINQNIMYIQNREFTGNEDISGDKIEIGYDVTTSIPKGDVILKDGADLKLNSTFGTIIKNGFKCEKGAKLTIN